jgi:Family of unknown function (DUF6932)
VAIPALNRDGLLPPGVHRATLEEIVYVFCTSTPTRRALEAPLRELVATAQDARATGLFLDGSFVSEKSDPGDIDAVIVLPNDFAVTSPEAMRIQTLHRTYGFDIERVRAQDEQSLHYLLREFFAYDRSGRPRGLLEVAL